MSANKKKAGVGYTINDIAKHTGLSRSTVSRVINQSENVSEQAKNKVLHAIEELGYVPNMIARGLRTHAPIIGVIVQNILNPYYIEALYEIEKLGKNHGYALLNMNSDSNPQLEEENIYQMLGMKVQGIILIGNMLDENDRIVQMALNTTNLVCMEGVIKGADNIVMKADTSIDEMVEHLVSLGHTSYGLVHHAMRSFPIQMREQHFRESLEKRGHKVEDKYVFFGDDYLEQLASAKEENRLPTVVFALNDSTAFYVYRWCRENNIVIPDELSVVGFDNVKTYDMMMPTLTTISQPIGKAAEHAAKIVLDRITEKEKGIITTKGSTLEMDTHFLQRGSTGVFKGS